MEQRIAPNGPGGFTVVLLAGAILAMGTLAGSLGETSGELPFGRSDSAMVGAKGAASAYAAGIGPAPRRLTEDELDQAALEAGWPRIHGWWPEMRRIIIEDECPALNTHCLNPDDPNGGSHGLAQLNGRQHFEMCGEDFAMRYDPVVNLRTALCLRAKRGNFGGPGGWSGADRLGIP